jgi:hypothetical protein
VPMLIFRSLTVLTAETESRSSWTVMKHLSCVWG